MCIRDRDRLGLNAFVVFFAVCQRAYGARGYYLPWPAGEAVMIRRALGSEVTGQYISDVVDLCLDLGLFHADTFAQDVYKRQIWDRRRKK